MLSSVISSGVDIADLIICTLSSLVLGFLTSLVYMFKNNRYTMSLVTTLALLPAMVQLVIMMVNGNIGAGVAVAGAFSLVRFRSVAGGAREILFIFLSMALGLATGMGYITMAAVFFVFIAPAVMVLSAARWGDHDRYERELRITIPDTLDYDGIFDGIFSRYTKKAELIRVKTTNMGTLYELSYRVVLNDAGLDRRFIDEIRCLNGNLNIVLGRISEQEVL